MPLLGRIFSQLQRTPVTPGDPEPRGHYQPTREYHPTMVPVKCSACGAYGICEFMGGFNLRDGDRLMAGKPIPGICKNPACPQFNRQVDLVPIKLDPKERRDLAMDHGIREALAAHVERGVPVAANGTVIPKGRMDAHGGRKDS